MQPRTLEVLAFFDEQRAILKSAFDSTPVEIRERAPALDRWSPANIVEHLAIVETRIASILSERIQEARAAGIGQETSTEPLLPTLDVGRVYDRTTRVKAPETAIPTGLDSVAAWSKLESATSLLKGMAQSGDGLALLSVLHSHPRFGPMSVYQWIAFLGAHETRHASQIREILL